MTPEEDLETKEIMQGIGRFINNFLPPDFGFILMIFKFNEKSRLNYIANCQREDAIKLLKEFIEKTEKAWAKDRNDGKFGIGKKQS